MARKTVVPIVFLFVVLSAGSPSIGVEEQPADNKADELLQEQISALVGMYGACEPDYAGYELCNGVGCLCDSKWAIPLDGWSKIRCRRPARGVMMTLPPELMENVLPYSKLDSSGYLRTVFWGAGCSVQVVWFRDVEARRRTASVNGLITELREGGIDPSQFRHRIAGMSDVDIFRADAKSKYSVLRRPTGNIDEDAWRYYILSMRADLVGKGGICREFTYGARTVLCYSQVDLGDSYFVKFRVFNAGELEYEIVVSQAAVKDGRYRSDDAEFVKQTKERIRTICCGVMAHAFLKGREEPSAEVRREFERTLGADWVREFLGEVEEDVPRTVNQ